MENNQDKSNAKKPIKAITPVKATPMKRKPLNKSLIPTIKKTTNTSPKENTFQTTEKRPKNLIPNKSNSQNIKSSIPNFLTKKIFFPLNKNQIKSDNQVKNIQKNPSPTKNTLTKIISPITKPIKTLIPLKNPKQTKPIQQKEIPQKVSSTNTSQPQKNPLKKSFDSSKASSALSRLARLSNEKRVPIISKVIAIFSEIIALISITLGIFFLLNLESILNKIPIPYIGIDSPIILGLIFLSFGILNIVSGIGLWKGKTWARIIVIIISSIGITTSVTSIILKKFVGGIIGLIISLAITGYLIFSKKVRETFK